jgi:hypothetical protein
MKIIYSGLESSGKSLFLAREAERILLRNAKWFKQSGITRTIRSNIKFSYWFETRAMELHIPLVYWENLEDIVGQADCDIFIDEIGTYFDARTWEDLTLSTRRWIAQASKLGVEMYGAAQDFAQVDKSYRRLVNELWYIKKLIGSTRPSNTRTPVKQIWGVCRMRSLDPRNYSEDDNVFRSVDLFPKFFFIRRHDCELFDTRQMIKRSASQPFLHEERVCPTCGFTKVSHK